MGTSLACLDFGTWFLAISQAVGTSHILRGDFGMVTAAVKILAIVFVLTGYRDPQVNVWRTSVSRTFLRMMLAAVFEVYMRCVPV